MGQDDIDEIIVLFDKYRDHAFLQPGIGKITMELGEEARRRLLHMKFAIEHIKLLESKIRTSHYTKEETEWMGKIATLKTEREKEEWYRTKPQPIHDVDNLFRNWDELTFFVDAFYYQSFRCAKCIEKLPTLESFKTKYKGVQMVRNKLIEHADKGDSMVLKHSMLLPAEDTGPKYKNSRDENDSSAHQDRGLYANLREFLGNLKVILVNSSN